MKTIDEAEIKYHVIHSWWLSSGAVTKEDILGLFEWLGFWHFHYRQWVGHMILVSASSLCISDVILLLNIHDIYLHKPFHIICVMFVGYDNG